MSLLTKAESGAAQAIAGIVSTNPFLPGRAEVEKRALGDQYVKPQLSRQFHPNASVQEMFPNAPALNARGEQLLEEMRRRLTEGKQASDRELLVYEDLAIYILFSRYISISSSNLTILQYKEQVEKRIVGSYDAYRKAFHHFFGLPGRRLPSNYDLDVIFATLFQAERAFVSTFTFIIGGSRAAVGLRAATWQSVFTHDMHRYSRALYGLMGNVTTLITGPSGTGKELVARAIALSSFIEFDSKNRRFKGDYRKCFHGLNLSALPSSLIESELFGHVEGAFTGANKDHAGYLDEKVCRSWDTVFLDEIGDVDQQTQTKLLRVLQNREFQRVGDVEARHFKGKIVTATNRDLAAEMEAGRFREDFYYRLCADQITTPSLREQLKDQPDDLPNFVRFNAKQLLPNLEEEVEKLTGQAVAWIDAELGPDYSWPGNIRELEQCVRSIMIRGSYTPTTRGVQRKEAQTAREKLLSDVEAGRLKRDELLENYFSLVYSQCGSYRATAKRLDTDWRTIQRLVNRGLVRRFAGRKQ